MIFGRGSKRADRDVALDGADLCRQAFQMYRSIQSEVGTYGFPLAGERVILFDQLGEHVELANPTASPWKATPAMISRMIDRGLSAVAAIHACVGDAYTERAGTEPWTLVRAMWPAGSVRTVYGGVVHRDAEGRRWIAEPAEVHQVWSGADGWLWRAIGGSDD